MSWRDSTLISLVDASLCSHTGRGGRLGRARALREGGYVFVPGRFKPVAMTLKCILVTSQTGDQLH